MSDYQAPLGSGRSNYVPPAVPVDPAAIPLPLPTPAADASEPAPTPASADGSSPASSTGTDTPATPDAIPAPATTDGSATESSTDTAPFDLAAFQSGLAALKQTIIDRRTKLTTDIGGLNDEDTELQSSIADWDARANAAEARRKQIEAILNTKLTSFSELDQATAHLDATQALLYPQTPAQGVPASGPTSEPTA